MTVIDSTGEAIVIRRAQPADAVVCGPICYEAFAAINAQHNYAPEIPSPEAATGLLTMLFGHPSVYAAAAEYGGRLVGSNCLDERSPIAGIGPITVDPAAQNRGIGKMLMRDVMERAHRTGFIGMRLVQSAFHARSLSLYTRLGFQVREPLVLLRGPALRWSPPGVTVRRARAEDLDACNRVCVQVHGHNRSGETQEAIDQQTATVVERQGRITGYSTILGFFGHSVGETLLDLQSLIGAAEEFAGPGILAPTRLPGLFPWCLEHGLRVVQPLNLMSHGFYQEPEGAWLPSILY
ncbi:MAG TPA: GNAT family N-acetyltransferase [Bryobacteraceae bacterium]|nr:GNAT family N-acetyltransferase [Bryobacteraceae bacterium]